MSDIFLDELQLPEGLSLESRPEGLVLTDGVLSLCADFAEQLPRLRKSNLEREMLVKAARIKGNPHPSVIDATAGLGEDSILLAAAGCSVTLYELDPVIAALLENALERAASLPELQDIAARMHLIKGDSIAAMQAIGKMRETAEYTPAQPAAAPRPGVILLDPMFPERKKSALIKKKFQLLQQLERPCGNEEELLQAALFAHPRKIVIKRPLKGPYLAGRKPDYSLSGKAIRYDCIVLA